MTPKKKYTEQDLKNSIAWHRQWYANRPQVNKIDKYLTDAQLDSIENGKLPIEFGSVQDDMLGGYDKLWNKIYTTPETTARILNHEVNHAATGRSLITGIRDMINIRKNIVPIGEYRQGYEDNVVRWKSGGNDATSDYAYLTNPSEVQTRLMRLRQLAGFKPEQTIDRKTLDTFMGKYKNGQDEEIDQLLDIVPNADNMLNLLNKVSDTKQTATNATVAADGAVITTKLEQVRQLLDHNKQLNFVDRIINWKNAPSLDLGDGTKATHKMSYLTDDKGQAYVFPTVIYNKEKKALEQLPVADAWKYAKANKEYIQMSAADAEDFSSWGYKAAADWPKDTYQLPEYENGGIVNTRKINAEGGEVVQLPNGMATELQGPSHQQGGIDLNLPEGSVVFSDKLGIKDENGNFKTLAERKSHREKEVARLDKLLSIRRDPLLKNTLERIKKNNEKEESIDVMLQQLLNGNNGSDKTVYAADGAVMAGATAFNTLAGLYGTLQNANNTAEWKANRAQMPNFYEDYGKRSIEKLNELNLNLETQKAHALTTIDAKLQEQNQTNAAQIDAAGGTINLKRALRSAGKYSTDRAYASAYTGLESDYTAKLAENTREIADTLAKQDEAWARGASKAFEDKQNAYDTFYSSKSQNISDTTKQIGNIAQGVMDIKKYNADQDLTNRMIDIQEKYANLYQKLVPNDNWDPDWNINHPVNWNTDLNENSPRYTSPWSFGIKTKYN